MAGLASAAASVVSVRVLLVGKRLSEIFFFQVIRKIEYRWDRIFFQIASAQIFRIRQIWRVLVVTWKEMLLTNAIVFEGTPTFSTHGLDPLFQQLFIIMRKSGEDIKYSEHIAVYERFQNMETEITLKIPR